MSAPTAYVSFAYFSRSATDRQLSHASYNDAASDLLARGATLTVPITGHTARETIAAITELGIEPDTLTTRKPTLDDVYLQLTGSRIAA